MSQRTIKNAYVNTNSVKVEPGASYCNWVPITKQKLKIRDDKLLSIKIQKTESVVNAEISRLQPSKTDFVQHHSTYTIDKQIIADAFNQLHKQLDSWTGVRLTKIKQEIKSFKQYYDIGKRWWNCTKKKLLGDIFWFRIFKNIQQYVKVLTSCNYFKNEQMILCN
eukprot:391056_1